MSSPVIWEMNGPMNRGGTESLIMELLREKNPGTDIRLVIHSSTENYSGSYDSEIKQLQIPVIHMPAYGAVGYRAYKKAFMRIINQHGCPDIIHIHMNAVGGMIARVAKECGISIRIVHCHADIKYRGSKLNLILNEIRLQIMRFFVNRYATDYWACSEAAARRLFYNWKKYIIIPNMINVNSFIENIAKKNEIRASLCGEENVLILGSIGRVAPIKNYEIAIETTKLLRDLGYNAHYYCYGRIIDENYYNVLEMKINKEHIVDCIHFMGETNCVAQIVPAFDFFLMPSIKEGLGISALEAQAAGVPTLVSPGVPHEADMGLGLFQQIENNSPLEWANMVLNFKRPDLTPTIILNAFNEKHYNSYEECKNIEKLYYDLWKEGK